MKIKFSDLKIGDKVKLLGFNPSNGSFIRKLLTMGFIPQIEFEMTRIAPFGDTIELKTPYSSICVRRQEVSEILCLEKICS